MGRETTVTGRILVVNRLRNTANGNARYAVLVEWADGTGVLEAVTKPDSAAAGDIDNLKLCFGDQVTVTVTGAGFIRTIDRASP